MGFPGCSPVAVAADLGGSTLECRGSELNAVLADLARRALRASAAAYGLSSFPFDPPKDSDGRPMAFEGLHWSISHKPECVAAVVAPWPVGIDVEEVRPRTESLLDYVMNPEEWGVFDAMGGWDAFFRTWTAKEAVLKAVGTGLAGLSRCRVSGRTANGLKLNWNPELQQPPCPWRVSHFRIPGHIVSVTVEPGLGTVRWLFIDRPFLDRVSLIKI